MTTPHTMMLAQREHVEKRVEQFKHRSREVKAKLKDVLKQLWNPERGLAVINSIVPFIELRRRFPNFSQAIDILESNAIALKKLDLPYEANPMLLVGEPGLGKTLFVSEFARLMGLPFFEINMSTISATFALTGGTLQWGEAEVGFIAKSLVSSQFANPIIMVDEIDKCGSGKQYNPMTAFYSLLESHTARRFKDEALEIELDASRIIWILTANELNDIPEPIQSRMQVVHIHQPAKHEMPEVVQSIYASIRSQKAYGRIMQETLNAELIDQLSSFSPRAVRMALDTASLNAVKDGRTAIQPADIKLDRKERYHVGFLG